MILERRIVYPPDRNSERVPPADKAGDGARPRASIVRTPQIQHPEASRRESHRAEVPSTAASVAGKASARPELENSQILQR
jgi:hypothetical protein